MKGQKRPDTATARTGPEARVEARVLVAEGYSVSFVARRFGVKRATVRQWRDSPEGVAHLAELRAARKASLGDAIEAGRQALRAAAPKAIATLVEQLDARSPLVAIAAARDILDRAGILRSEQLELPKGPRTDFSKFTTEELREWKRLRAKGRTAPEA